MFTFTGVSPADAAASIPARTRATGKPTSFIAVKGVIVERVEADRYAVEAGVLECLGFCGEGGAVGGERDVADPVDVGEHRDEMVEVSAQ